MHRYWFFLIFIFLIAVPQLNHAQVQTSETADNSEKEYKYDFQKRSFESNIPLNEVSAKAFRHFTKNYTGSNNETWIKTADGLMVVFRKDSTLYKVFYTFPGRFLYSIKYYLTTNYPLVLNKIIGNTYPGYHIKNVVESFDGRKTDFDIQIINATTTRNIELANGETKITGEFDNE